MAPDLSRFPDRRTLLLTGASGVLGSALLPRLRREHSVICLTHRSAVATEPAHGPVETVRGDLAAPRLGLGTAAYDELAARIDGVIHTAAITRFNAAPEEYERVNVEGTQRILELAARARVPIEHVSTAFVRLGGETGGYERSKRAAEDLVRGSGLDYRILRPSLLAGDRGTGFMPVAQGLHHVMNLVFGSALPMVPADPEGRVDFLPRDLVADRIAEGLGERSGPREAWLTAGERALTLGRMVELALAQARARGLDVVPPRIVTLDMFERLVVPAFLPALPRRLQRFTAAVLPLCRYISVPKPFPSSLAELGIDPETEFLNNLARLADRRGAPRLEVEAVR